MIPILIITVIATALMGLFIKNLGQGKHAGWYTRAITWPEFAIGVLISSLLIAPLTGFVGYKISLNNKLTFKEFWNGKEVAAVEHPIRCTRDGPCYWDYSCDPYIVTYPCSCGKNCTTVCTRTQYHSCPYVNYEYTYVVESTIGSFTIDRHRFPVNPNAHRWRASERVPNSVIKKAGTGPHPFWLDVKERLARNEPGPVTKLMDYENFILASEHTILSTYSSDVAHFDSLGLLPDIANSVYAFYHADKAYFVGTTRQSSWISAVEYFNSVFGVRQGDLHLVLVQHPEISTNPDRYKYALNAYWQDKERFKKHALPKNALVLIVGTDDGKTVSFIRAFTGMPSGNERTITMLESYRGMAFNPLILGRAGSAYTIRTGQSLIEATIFEHFRRVTMGGEGDGGETGFAYLKGEIKPGPIALFIIALIILVLSGVYWAVAFHHDLDPTD